MFEYVRLQLQLSSASKSVCHDRKLLNRTISLSLILVKD